MEEITISLPLRRMYSLVFEETSLLVRRNGPASTIQITLQSLV